MADRLLALDFDGVLNHSASRHFIDNNCESINVEAGLLGTDPACVAVLESIIARTDAKIVISSTWRRLFSFGQIRRQLRHMGFTHDRAILGVTPHLGLARGLEIQAWLDGNSYHFEKPPPTLVILDDDRDMAHLLHRFVLCDPFKGGLTREIGDRVVEMLMGGDRG